MTPELEAHLRSFVNFPSPPGVASHIIELAQDPNIEMGKVAHAIGMDPALSTKVLRIANSPLYAQRRRSENLRQALVILGLNATLTLALSFSLVKSLRSDKPNGVNYPWYWRRALLSAVAARAIGDRLAQPLAEERFLAGLLQDVGMLALDRGVPDLYRDVGDVQRKHRALQSYEKRRLGVDHAEVGAWLMRTWNLPERLCSAIQHSHSLDQTRARSPDDIFNRCVTLSGSVADIFLSDPPQRPFVETAQAAERILGLAKEDFAAVLDVVGMMICETENLFETDILNPREPELILEQAREILMIRNLQNLRNPAGAPGVDGQVYLSEESRRDPLTGVFTRAYFDVRLAREFNHASRHDWPLTVALIDLDGLRRINETSGSKASDAVLQSAAQLLRGNSRETDVIARYSGDKFALILPATDKETAAIICSRVISAFQQAHQEQGGNAISVVASVGHATQWKDARFNEATDLLKAAEQAVYTAKLQGRNRSLAYEANARTPTVQFL